uniref:Uncharacterized protein n=1 Tax=Oryzias latipes TaxID=8090 RepID=A0A3P9KP94_ORYLA
SKLLKKVQSAAGGLTAQGCRVEDSDLYAIQFQVSAPAEDINRDVKDEGSLANLVIFQFHRYWFIVGLNGLCAHMSLLKRSIAAKSSCPSPLTFWNPCSETLALGRHEHHSLANAVLHMYGFQVLLPQIFWVLSSEAHKGILALMTGGPLGTKAANLNFIALVKISSDEGKTYGATTKYGVHLKVIVNEMSKW